MKEGDIDNRSAPRVVFVWEGLLAQLPPESRRIEHSLCRRRKFSKALDLWEQNEHMRHALVDITWRSDVAVDLLCIHPEGGFSRELKRRLDLDEYPYGHLYSMSLMRFDQELAYLPNVIAVYHAIPDRPFLYGRRGRLVSSPDQFLPLL